MNYVFFGTPRFAAIILESLIKSAMPPIALVCNPDRPVGRKKVITPPPTKIVATNYKLQTTNFEVLQPEKLDAEFLSKLRSYNADFFVVAAYAKILRRELLDIPRLGVIGVHPSLLPKYRGASPIQSAILNQEAETGVDLFMIDEKVDHGSIVSSVKCQILENDNYLTLEKKLAELGANLLVDTLPKFVKGEIEPIPQDENIATFTKKFETEDGFVEYEKLQKAQSGDMGLAKTIHAKIRALSQEPGVYTIKDGKRIKLLKSVIENDRFKLIEIQYEGKTPVANNSII